MQSPTKIKDTAHASAVMSMFGRIVPWYDFLNTFLSLGQDKYWRKYLAAQTYLGQVRVLDLAAGTLDVSLAINKFNKDAQIYAFDFCLPMLLQGKKKLAEFKNTKAAQSIFPATADALLLPIKNASFNCITMAFGIRNIKPRAEAFAEMYRVLVPGGKVCILEFGSGQNIILGGVYNFYLNYLLPLIGRIFSGQNSAYKYLADSIVAFPSAEDLANEMRTAGFINVEHTPLSFGIVRVHTGQK